MAEFDIVSKQLFKDFPADFVRFVLGRENAEVLGVIDTEQPTVESHRADSVARVSLDGQEVLVHTEFQTSDSTHTPMPIRMAGYIGWLIESYRLPVLAHVVYLRPDAGARDPGRYSQDIAGYQVVSQYKVIRLIDIPGESVLTQQSWGLIPFAPLMKPPDGLESDQWLRRCVREAFQVPLSRPNQTNFLTDLALLSGLVYNYETITDIISEETMFESVVAQKLAERGILQGIEQGERKRSIEAVVDVLLVRFEAGDIDGLKPTIEAISALDILRQLLRKAAQANTLDEFKRSMSAIVQSGS